MPGPPRRIISLVPSLTEYICDLGESGHLAGITKFCVHPEKVVNKIPKIGGTKTPDMRAIFDLNPDLIIANKEENNKGDIDKLRSHFPVYVSDVKDLPGAYEMMIDLGHITGKDTKAKLLVKKIQSGLIIHNSEEIECLYVIWKRPCMVAAGNTFISSMMELAGMKNVVRNLNRYPVLTTEEIRKINPQVILLSSEPFRFREKHVNEFQEEYPDSLIKLVDGELFSWYGSRLQHSGPYLRQLKHELQSELESES